MNLNKTKLSLVSVALISFLMGASVVYVVYGQTASTFWVTEGKYPANGTFSFWREGSTYYAKNSYGQIMYSGTNASLVIQNAFDNADYGRFFFYSSIYEIDVTIEVTHSNVVIEGEAETSDLSEENPSLHGGGVKWLGDGSINLLYIYGLSRATALESIVVKNICFDGGAVSYSSGSYGIKTRYVAELWIKDNGIRRNGDSGLWIEEGNEIIYIKNNDISLNYGSGIDLNTTGTDNLAKVYITDNHLWNNSGHGIKFNSPNADSLENSVKGNVILGNGYSGVQFTRVKSSIISNNIVASNDVLNTATYHGIYLTSDSANNIISNNRVFDNDNYELYIDSDYCLIYGNELSGTDREGIVFSNGVNNLITANRDFVTENSENSTGTSPITVTHGLAGTPDLITITPTSDATSSYVTNIGTTTFQIVFTSGGTKTFFWYCEYKP